MTRLIDSARRDVQAARVREFLVDEAWPQVPAEVIGRSIGKAERERLLRHRAGGRVIVDSSALVAVLLREPGYEAVLDELTEGAAIRVGAPTLVEAGIVLTARIGLVGKTLLARLLAELGAEVVEVGTDHWTVAADAFMRYGKGRHPAALNLGDCLTYAVARVSGDPLLCLGGDFPQTDLALVLRK